MSSDQAKADERAAGIAGAVDGMERAKDHADRVAPGWSDRALTYLRRFLAMRGTGGRFIAPDVRDYAYATGLDRPPNERAWGSVLQRASRLGWIHEAGWGTYGDKTTNVHPVRAWRVNAALLPTQCDASEVGTTERVA